jgi:hypothetical protein
MMPRLGDQVPVRVGDGVELGLFNGLVEAGVQGVQNVQDSDEGGGSGNRLGGDDPGKPGCDNLHGLSRRVGSGHRKAGVMDTKLVWVWWEGDVKAGVLGFCEEIVKRGWGRCGRGEMGAVPVGNNWALLHGGKCVWW